MKLRVWVPSPQMSISCLPVSLASITLRQRAAGRFLTSAIPGAVRAIDVVEAGDVGLQAALGPVFLAEHFRHQLLPAVAALGHGRIGIRFFQRAHVRVLLQGGVVGAGRGREEVAADASPVGGLDHVGIDQDAAQAFHAEALDKAHPAHIGRQVIDFHRAFDGADGSSLFRSDPCKGIPRPARAGTSGQRLFIDGADMGEALIVEITGQRAGDEAACTGNDDQIIFT